MAGYPDDNMAALLFQSREHDYSENSSFSNSGRATYFSANTRNKTAVYASTPAGSKHAARIQKICGSLHANAIRDPPPSSAAKKAIRYENGHARILPAEPIAVEVPAIAPIVETQLPSSHAYQHQHGYQPQPQTHTTQALQQQQQPSWPTAVAARTGSSVRVTRYEDGGQLAYHSKSNRAELYVSAPQGSQEAMMFEQIAQRVVVGNHNAGSRRIVEQEAEEEEEEELQLQPQQQVEVRRRRDWGWF